MEVLQFQCLRRSKIIQGEEVWKDKAPAGRYLNGVRGAMPLAKEQFDVVLKLIEINKKPVRAFLDLGSGDGIMASVILSAYPEAKGVLLDILEHMIAAVREKLDKFKYNLGFTVFDYGDRNWTGMVKSGAPYDVIISGLSIHQQPDERKREIYKEVFGLLGKGGLFINLEHVASPTKWVSSLFSETFIDWLYEMNKKKNPAVTREWGGRTKCTTVPARNPTYSRLSVYNATGSGTQASKMLIAISKSMR